jgi:hypothetical protein
MTPLFADFLDLAVLRGSSGVDGHHAATRGVDQSSCARTAITASTTLLMWASV